MPSQSDDAVARLATLVGVSADYVDAYGSPVATPLETRQNLLGHLGFPSATPAELGDSLARAEAMRGLLLPRTAALAADRPSEIPLKGTTAGTASWRLTDESGGSRSGQSATRTAAGRSVLRLPALAAGYYELDAEVDGRSAHATLIVAPSRCWQPAWMRDGGRAWGLAAQVYAFRSRGNLGIGTFADVAKAAAGAGELGASFIGLSPVHALFESDRTKVSPYSPSSRLFLETLHIDPAVIEGFAGTRAAAALAEPECAARISALREVPLVDHAGIWAELSPVLEALWSERRWIDVPAFATFRREMGLALHRHAVFEALSEHFRGQGLAWLGEWPAEYRDAGSTAVAGFAAKHDERVAYHAWLQWLADTQLAEAAAAARGSGMSVGLYRDLAVGSDRGGSELWSAPERFAGGLSIGAPPDLLAPQGQDWGLPPLNPAVLEEQGLVAFRDLVRANMRHAGAIRIDHAFQLRRLYLIPVGGGGTAGAYVDYPFQSLLAVLRLESHRAKALVIAEDLGTGPEGFSDEIMRSGLLSYRVLSFERDKAGGFKRPTDYPKTAMSVVTTHDLPTFVGWWRGLDTDLRQALGLYDPDRAETERAERVVERQKLVQALAEERIDFNADQVEAPPTEAVVRFLARTSSALNAIQYEDVLGGLNQPNLPGTTEGHPNWRRKLEADLETINAPHGPLARIGAAVASEGRGRRAARGALAAPPPRATFRFQFHKGFTFDDAVAALPYVERLGISHVYASPIQTARPGSTHGYDIVDHAHINPELGGEDGFYRLSEALRARGLGLILDIVPNHMGVGGGDNAWWLSVLEWGSLSPYAMAFDIDWERLGAGGKLVVPVLGERYGEALEDGQIRIAFDADSGSFSAWQFDQRLPLSPLSYPLILDRALAALDSVAGQAELIAVSDRLRTMAEETFPERRAGFVTESEELKRRIAGAVAGASDVARAIERALALVNGVPGLPESFGTLHRILEMQAYRPAHWRVAASDINYRRFFDINTLAGIRVELPEVFRATHELIFRLVGEGRIQGLRIDHVDGLADPDGYLRNLQAAVGPGFYVVVEKILEPGEALRSWPIAGTTGYDVLNVIDGLFVEPANAEAFETSYRDFTGVEGRYFDQLRAAKTEILQSSFASELEVLCSDLKRIADSDRRTRDYTTFGMRIVLSEVIARFPVYRSYVTGDEPSAEDVTLIEETIAAAKRSTRLPDLSLHDFVAAVLLGRVETEGSGRPSPDHVDRFRRRFQQLTGPVMAKSLEDTLFYRFGRLISLNEVGGDPAHFGLSTRAFHEENKSRSEAWPNAMIATATHDTKRGEDARARLAALSEIPDAWRETLAGWSEWVAPHLGEVEGAPAPDANDQYILLQSLLGAWPIELLDHDDDDAVASFRERFLAFAEKAFREAKRHTSWVNPNEAYEQAVKDLIGGVLAPGSQVLARLRPLALRLAQAGMVNGLVRTVLKATLPGVPDIYQGTGTWDFSLVDPDNRRPVDYEAGLAALDDDSPLETLVSQWHDGRVKHRILARLLADRKTGPRLYADGDYKAVEATGERSAHLVAYERNIDGEGLMVVAARMTADLSREGLPIGAVWNGTRVPMRAGAWENVLTGAELTVGPGGVDLSELFERLPVAVFRRAA